MSDNTLLNSGTGGDTIRAVDHTGVKTQVVALDAGGAGAESLVTATNPLPMSVNAANFVFSTNNSSTVQLAAGAQFTGVIETALNQPAISLLMTADQPMLLTVSQYIDLAGTYAVPSISFSVLAGQQFSRSFTLNGNYVRVTAKNLGSATTTTFNLNTAYGTLPAADGQGNAPSIIVGSGDYSGVSLLEACVSGDLALTVNPINAEKRDINGAQVPSDSPQVVNVATAVVGQQVLIDTQGYQTLSLTMGTMAATVTGCNTTNGTFAAISCFPVVLGAPVTTAAANTNYIIPCFTRYIKLTVTTIGWCVYNLRQQPLPIPYLANQPVNVAQYLGAAASSTNPVHTTQVALAATNNQTLGGIVVSATAPAATVIKATAGRLTMLDLYNGSSAVAFFHLYNAASVTLGTTASIHSIGVAANSGKSVTLPDGGLFFSTGICAAWTNLPATTDNTALTAAGQTANYAFI